MPFGLALGQGLGPLGFVHGQAGVEVPVDEDAVSKEIFWRVALGRSYRQGRLAFGRTWTPMAELVASRELGDETQTSWAFVPQLQVTLNQRQHVMANWGLWLPMTDIDARPTQVMAYLLWDWFDGGLFDGW